MGLLVKIAFDSDYKTTFENIIIKNCSECFANKTLVVSF